MKKQTAFTIIGILVAIAIVAVAMFIVRDGQVSSLQADVAAKESDIEALNTRTATQEIQAALLTGTNEQLEADLKTAQEEADKVPGLEADLETAQEQAEKVPGLEADLKTAQEQAEKVPGLEADLKAAQAEAEKVPGLEADLKAAQAEAEKVPGLKAALEAATVNPAAGRNVDVAEIFPSWNPDSEPLKNLIAFVADSTDESNPGYIPAAHRIAVFAMDGTLMCETYFTYYDTMMFIDYCLYDHPDQVSDELKQVAAAIKPGYTADEALARNFAKAYAGMTVEEYYQYAVEFGKKNTASFNNMRYIDNFYLPMVELVKYLYDNGYTIYVISGTERTTARAVVANSPISEYVTPNHVIGTDFEVKQKGFEHVASNLEYKYEQGSDLVLTGGFVQKNLNANKSIYVEREIGQRPVLAFGNSGSDTSMMNYAIDSRNVYPAQAYMIVADDSEREWGTQDWEKKSAEYTEKGFTPVSMKNDFAQIYPEGITKAPEQYREHDWSDAPWYQEEELDDAA